MSRPRQAMGLAGVVVAFVSVVALKSNGYPSAVLAIQERGWVPGCHWVSAWMVS